MAKAMQKIQSIRVLATHPYGCWQPRHLNHIQICKAPTRSACALHPRGGVHRIAKKAELGQLASNEAAGEGLAAEHESVGIRDHRLGTNYRGCDNTLNSVRFGNTRWTQTTINVWTYDIHEMGRISGQMDRHPPRRTAS